MPIPVDKLVEDRTKFFVYENYGVILNQTSIENNNNKFYIIQILTDKTDYYVWTRWGRVGENGKFAMDKMADLSSAKSEFEKKFKAKTGNKFESIENFVFKEGKYSLVKVEHEEVGNSDANVLGKLSVAQIESGQKVLENLEKLLLIEGNKNENSKIKKLSSEFYTLIPTVTGRKKPEPISEIKMLKEKEEMLKFYLRMGFDEIEKNDDSTTPISGIMKLKLAETLEEAINCCSKSDIKSSINKGKELMNRKAGNPIKEMNQELYGSIMLYTSNAIYQELNKLLRDQNKAGLKKYLNYLRMFFEAMERLPKVKKTLWRGISVDLYNNYKVGKTITWWGVSSCTSEKSVAENFMKGCGQNCTFLTIETYNSTDISDISFYSSEKESLLAPGTQLEVISSEKKGNVTHIYLKEVGRLID